MRDVPTVSVLNPINLNNQIKTNSQTSNQMQSTVNAMPKIDDGFFSNDLKRLAQLHAATQTANLKGTPGIEPVLLYRAITENLPCDNLPYHAWYEFLRAAHNTRHTALAIRTLMARVQNTQDTQLRGSYAHALGLYLHIIAQDDNEAVRAFAAAANGSITHAHAAIHALHRMHRDNPMCDDTTETIRNIRDKNIWENIAHQLSPETHTHNEVAKRAIKYIQHARQTMLESGDSSQVFTWLETAHAISPKTTQNDIIQMTTAIAWAMPDHTHTLKRALKLLKKLKAWHDIIQTMTFADELGCHIPTQLCLDMTRIHALCLDNAHHAADWIYRAALDNANEWLNAIQEQPWIALYATQYPCFMAALCEGMKQTHASEHVYEILQSPLQFFTPQTIADSIIQNPTNDAWGDFITSKTLWPEEHWIVVANIILEYLDKDMSNEILGHRAAEIIEHHIPKILSEPMLHARIDLCIHNDVLFRQVLRMSDNTQQHRETLEKIDAAIEMYAGDITQRNALLAKKYKTADMLGDERIKLSCLREIIESAPDNPFVHEEIQKIDPALLKPHSQILYYQLRIYVENQPELRLENQMALARLYTASSQLNNAITLYHSIIDENPHYLEPRHKLIELLESQENWKSAENTLLALINAETTKEGKYQALLRLANLQYERMAMTSRALMTYFNALDAAPEKLTELHNTLCDISEKIRSFAPLLDKYEDFSKEPHPYPVQKSATILLANIYAEYIKKPALAINVLDDFYQRGGAQDQEFVQMVLDFYEEIKNWNGYVQIFSDLMTHTDNSEEKILFALNIARVYANHIDDNTKAAQFATLAAQSEPQNAEQWLEIAEYLLAADALKDALICLQNAAQLETDPARQTLILFETVRLLSELDLLSDACLVFHQAAHLNPPLDQITPIAENLIALATTYQDKSAFEQICSDLILCCPESEKATLILQQALTLIHVFDAKPEAKTLIDNNLSKLTSLDLEQSLILTQVLTAFGEYRSTIQLNQNIMKQFKLNTEQKLECLTQIMNASIELNDIENVQKTAEMILEISPDDTAACFQLAQLDYYAGKWDKAASRIQNILPHQERLNADNAILMHYYYGEILHAAEHDDHAIKSLDKALHIRPDFRPAVDLKLTILLEKQRWNESLPVFNLLLELTEDPDVQGAIHKRIAEIYHFYLKDPERALIEYEQALALGGDVEDVPIRLLQLYQNLQLWQKAAMTAQILAMAQTNSPDAKFEYLMVLSHIQASHLGELADAINTCLEAFTLKPFHQDNLTRMVPLLIRTQQWENLNNIFNRLCGLIISKQDEAIEKLIWLSQTAGCYAQCKPAIERVDKYIKAHHIDVDLIAEAEKGIPAPEITLPASAPTRKRTPTAPRGSLTYDSGLRTNPELQNPKRTSSLSMMAVPTKLSGSSSVKTTNTSLKPVLAGISTETRQVKLPKIGELSQNTNLNDLSQAAQTRTENALKPISNNTLKPAAKPGENASSSSPRHAAAETAIASIQSGFTSKRVQSAPQQVPATIVQTRQNPAIMKTLAQSTVQPIQNTRVTIAPAVPADNTALKANSQPAVPPIPKLTGIEAINKADVHTSNLFSPAAKQPAMLKTATQNIEKIQFSIEDLNCLAENASQNKAELTSAALNDLLKHAGNTTPELNKRPLPEQILDLTRQTLLASTSASVSPGISKLLNVLVSSPNSPALVQLPALDPDTIPEQYRNIFTQLTKILKIENTQFALSHTQNLIANTCPPSILIEPEQIQNMTLTLWTARAATSLILCRPESLLCATLPPANVMEHLNTIVSIANAARTKTNIHIPNSEQYLQTLQDTNMMTAIMPRITPETLASIKHYAIELRNTALQAAFILSQSLSDCIAIAAELEGIRTPTNLSTLKSAMKQSSLIKGLVTFAISPNAQRLYTRIFS